MRWLGNSRRELCGFPDKVRREIGQALWFAQMGDKHPSAKPLRGFGGAGVLEIIEDHAGNTYRAAYTVRFARAVYVLHAFQKKSVRGIETPRHQMELIASRLRAARVDYDAWVKGAQR